jgi:hypothetical protein
MAKMNNENKYFTYYDALFATAVLCVTFLLQLSGSLKELEDRCQSS